jgi:hypothetical protein
MELRPLAVTSIGDGVGAVALQLHFCRALERAGRGLVPRVIEWELFVAVAVAVDVRIA